MNKSKLFVGILGILFLGLRGNSPLYETKTYSHIFSSSAELEIGEDITYVVRYYLLKLGEIRLKVLSKKEVNGEYIYNTIAYIDSYSGIPFVDLHQIYESRINSSLYSNYFKGTIKKPEYTTYTEYTFDYKKSSVRVRKGKVSPFEQWTDSVGTAEKMYHDGLSIFYYARANLGIKKTEYVPCFVAEKKVYTKINYYTEPDKMDIEAIDYDIKCYRLDGETDFVSVFGLTGYFEGWFSYDKHTVPIVAKLNVIIGKVTVELIKWKKKGWNPPKYAS